MMPKGFTTRLIVPLFYATIFAMQCYFIWKYVSIKYLILTIICKRFYSFGLLIFASFFISLVVAQNTGSYTIGNLTYTYNDINVYEVSVKMNTLISGNLVIPYSVVNPTNNKEYVVTSLADNEFYNCTGLTSVTIPAA